MAGADDRPLVEPCIKKDPIAWAELVKKYSPLIGISIENIFKRYSFQYSRSDVDNIRQTIIISLWKDGKLAAIKDRSDISYWLPGVAGNSAVDHLREKTAHGGLKTVSIHETVDKGFLQEIVENIPSSKPTPKDDLLQKELSAYLKEAFSGLTAKERLMARLSLIHRKTHDDISKITRSPVGTVSSSVKRVKDKLREKMKKYLQEF